MGVGGVLGAGEGLEVELGFGAGFWDDFLFGGGFAREGVGASYCYCFF